MWNGQCRLFIWNIYASMCLECVFIMVFGCKAETKILDKFHAPTRDFVYIIGQTQSYPCVWESPLHHN